MIALLTLEIDRLAIYHAKHVAQPENLGFAALYARIAHTVDDLLCKLPPERKPYYEHIVSAIEGIH